MRIFPNDPALIRLLGAMAMEPNEQWLERRYLTFEDHEVKQPSVRTPRQGFKERKIKLQKIQHLTRGILCKYRMSW